MRSGKIIKNREALKNCRIFMAFNNMIRNCGLIEFPAVGNTISWQGKRGKQMI